MQALLQRLAEQGELQIAGATVYDLPVTQDFYQARGYASAWHNQAAVDELAAAIEQAWREGMSRRDYHQQQVMALLDGSLTLDAPDRDLLLTDSLVRLTYHYALGKVDPVKYNTSWNFDRDLPAVNPIVWMEQTIADGGIARGLETLQPTGPLYQSLVGALAKYRRLAANGDWGSVAEGPTLRLGDHGYRVAQLRQRLAAEGDSEVGSGTDPEHFDDGLERAVIRFQRRHRLDDDGIVGKQTLAALNVPIAWRIGQIKVNLERIRMLGDRPPTAVIVDIAGFEVSMYREGRRVFRGRAQVGRPYRSTPVFTDTISYIEFNPTWTVPPTIFRNDVLPAVKVDPGYLARKNMQVLTMAGEEVDPATVDWQLYPAQGFPYMIRQQPGPTNALGRLKIMFPNKYLVYLHDTPSRDLFNRSERTFSSGCIRVEDAERLAAALLDDPVDWSLDDIAATLELGKTRRVNLREPVPVYLAYWTVEVAEDGQVHFKRDPYDRDPMVLDVLEHPLVPEAARLPGEAVSVGP